MYGKSFAHDSHYDDVKIWTHFRVTGPLRWVVDPQSKVRGANMGPIWGRQDPGGRYAGSRNFAIWGGMVMAGDAKLWFCFSLMHTQPKRGHVPWNLL